MIGIVSVSGHTTYGLREFVLDAETDLEDLTVETAMGSTAFVIATKKKYMLTGSGVWVDVTTA